MARVKKFKDVQKFGGTDNLGQVKLNGHDHDAANVEASSETKLEHDEGHGDAAVIRRFTFGINPESFQKHTPTKQELFNAHYKGIEVALWRDGMKVMPEVEPRVAMEAEKGQYHIYVGAKPMKGHMLMQKPQTLSEIAHS